MAIDQAQVNTAADELAAKNESVTLAKVRDALGGGSFTTLSPMVKAWKAQHVAEAAAAEELPDEAQQAAEAAARTIWAAARADAAQRIELIQANANQRINDAETATAEALTEVERLEKTVAVREDEYQTLEQALDGARAARDEQTATVQAREATIEGLREQLTEQRANAAAASEKLDGLREQLAGERSRADSTQQTLDAERQTHAETRRGVDEQRSRADRVEERLASSQEALEAMIAERDTLRHESSATIRDLEKARAQAEARAEEMQRLRAELAAAKPSQSGE